MAQTPPEFIKRLTDISQYNGRQFGRLQLLYEEENKFHQTARTYQGYWALSDAFKCFFLETAEISNVHGRPQVTAPLSEHYGLMVPRIVHAFRYICGAEHLAEYGYPLQALTVLRNIFDSLVLTSAVLQKWTDFYSIEGVTPGKAFDERAALALRRRTEHAVRLKMTGSDSGLSQTAQEDLALVDKVYDHEVHGARLSLANATSYLRGQRGLSIVPQFEEKQMAAFFNRLSDTAWMLHRLLPLLQPPKIELPAPWAEKWRALDDSFRYLINELTVQLGKTIGASAVEFVEAKFPFNEHSTFPL
jgi:hypothetical protein